jgi:tungstate transport system substrate-binding protein
MQLKKRRMLLFLCLALVLTLAFNVLTACTRQEEPALTETQEKEEPIVKTSIILATTTSTENSGLLDFILPELEKDTGVETKVVAVGSGQALKMGEDGEADVLLAHAKSAEEALVAAGHGLERFDVMYNDFVILGPESDPAGIKANAGADVLAAFQLIYDNQTTFVSRGDDSGTHKAELAHWTSINVEPSGSWYIEAGRGMGEVIQMADEMLGYTLTDRATYLAMKDTVDIVVLVEGDTKLFNQYGVIAVNPDKNDRINYEGAQKFIDWILSEKGQNMIAEFGKAEFGESLFVPNAK